MLREIESIVWMGGCVCVCVCVSVCVRERERERKKEEKTMPPFYDTQTERLCLALWLFLSLGKKPLGFGHKKKIRPN